MLELETYDEPLIQDISYSYYIFSGDQTELDCCGTLGLSLSLPENAKTLIFERTVPHIVLQDVNNLHFIVKSEMPVTTDITIPDIYWGTYFRICMILADGTRRSSSIYSINDYIDQVDYESLLSSSSIEDASIDKVRLYVKDNELYVNYPDILSLSVFDINGSQIFCGTIHQSGVISLDKIKTPFCIVTYKTSNITQTKKILIQ